MIVKNKKHFRKLEKQRQHLMDYLLSSVKLICGSYSEVLVKCGRPGCHCQDKPMHPVTRLEIREDGKRRTKVVRASDSEYVKQLVDEYKKHKDALNELQKIHDEQKELLRKLISDKDEGYT